MSVTIDQWRASIGLFYDLSFYDLFYDYKFMDIQVLN